MLNFWNQKCVNESDAVRLSVQVRERCGWRDKCDCTFLDKVECKTIVDFYALIELKLSTFVLKCHILLFE